MAKKDMFGMGGFKVPNFNTPDFDMNFGGGFSGNDNIIGGLQSGAKKWKKNYKQMKQKYKGAKKSYGEARERVGELKEGLQRGTKDVKKKYRGLKRWVARHRR